MPVRCLSVHAPYRCRHTGECCSGVFAIPAEPLVRELVAHRGIGGGRRTGLFVTAHTNPRPGAQPALPAEAGSDGDWLDADLPVGGDDPAFVAARPDDRCVFWDPGVGGSCLIQREAGADALPSACRHFPRVFVRDGRECRGLRSIEWLRVALALLRNEAARAAWTARDGLTRERFVEAVRATDLVLVHRVDTAELARGLAVVEGQP